MHYCRFIKVKREKMRGEKFTKVCAKGERKSERKEHERTKESEDESKEDR